MCYQINSLATQLSDEICNILAVFYLLTQCDYYKYTNPFYRRYKWKSIESLN